MSYHRLLLPLWLFIIHARAGLAQKPDSLQVTSPNGKLRFSFSLRDTDREKGVPFYSIQSGSQPIVLPSRLGLVGNPNVAYVSTYTHDFRIVRVSRRSQNTTWKPPYGEQASYPDRYHEWTVTLDRNKAIMQLVVRAYDEGIAFRYHFPEALNTQILELGNERTEFALPAGTQGWYTPGAQREYQKRPLTGWTTDAELPLTLELPGVRPSGGSYAAIAVAEQVNFPRMRLKTTDQEGVLVSQLFGEVTETSPFSTPWRVVLVADQPGQLLEHNYLLLNLNPPSQISDPSWIRPGLVIRESKLSTDNSKKLVDFAVEQHIDYVHYDAGWYGYEYHQSSDATKVDVDPLRNPKKDLDLPEAIRYARSKSKGVILYVNHRALERQLDSLLPLYQRWGVSGIKFGFVHVGSHQWTRWLHEAVKKAAQYKLFVDVHDEYRPSGFSRTYPNLLTQEGIHGNEGFPDATHNTILPFTRFLAGAADYTFCFNIESIRPGQVKTTKCHQLALPVLYYSPLQFLFWYGSPELYPDRQEIAFWKGLPTVWDESRVLAGQPGEFAVIARRKNDTWYVGGITNTEARQLPIRFDFLDKGKPYQAEVYEDTVPNAVRKRTMRVTSETALTINVVGTGGVAIRVSAAQ